ncbi:GNAT family N-acetyltransferase [Ligilactobacillus acidipiscis]|uniref:Ribosomal-protein-S18p-alanine acetyltransferase n=1 Tax=Ligilactobacillus acidipiscis TaxID=89059 RepID=A0A0R2JK58_9LACO|nr:GNAT family N-acetyltransferase [Ligilactobacillus acidipiscis]KRN77643.1 ribosomal-protein-alanine acetyltransferase [Ligilactobacillus acidipiscis]SFV40230.1 Ribosomal-protein-S18p-alanine acetyltransferase [Ligilactobacillus acidipiscis]
MAHTLKNIKERLANKIKVIFQDKSLDFDNKDIVINGVDYFLCRNVISTIPEMVAVEQRSQSEEDIWNYNTFQLCMRDQKKALYFGLRQDDQLIGFIGCRVNASMTRMRIMRLSVLPYPDREKVAVTLVNTLFDKAAETGVRSVFVQVRTGQERLGEFYRNIGFKKAETAKNSELNNEVIKYQFLVSEK